MGMERVEQKNLLNCYDEIFLLFEFEKKYFNFQI